MPALAVLAGLSDGTRESALSLSLEANLRCPRTIAAIVNGTAAADLTGLAKTLPYSWAEQEECQKLPPKDRGTED